MMADLKYILNTDTYRDCKEEFMDMAKGIIPGNMINWLEDLGYFFAPAAKKYHGANVCGLVKHSMEVAKKLQDLTILNRLEWERPYSPIIVGLLHDICKCDDYIIVPPEYPWEKLGQETIDYNQHKKYGGHGDKSVQMILRYICETGDFYLTNEEEDCIRFHMGAFTEKEEWKYYSAAVANNENIMWTHHADMYASQVLKV